MDKTPIQTGFQYCPETSSVNFCNKISSSMEQMCGFSTINVNTTTKKVKIFVNAAFRHSNPALCDRPVQCAEHTGYNLQNTTMPLTVTVTCALQNQIVGRSL